MAKKLFSADDFDKHISVGDELVFDKPTLKTVKIDLIWAGTDLDVCAFLLGDDGMIKINAQLVDETGWVPKALMADEIHPTDAGYALWMKALAPVLGDL